MIYQTKFLPTDLTERHRKEQKIQSMMLEAICQKLGLTFNIETYLYQGLANQPCEGKILKSVTDEESL